MLLKEDYLARLLQTGRYEDPKRLERHGAKIYSQTDEDGIIAEIFSRIGVTDKRFIEFGGENGLEKNTLARLLQGWTSLWIGGKDEDDASSRERFGDLLT